MAQISFTFTESNIYQRQDSWRTTALTVSIRCSYCGQSFVMNRDDHSIIHGCNSGSIQEWKAADLFAEAEGRIAAFRKETQI